MSKENLHKIIFLVSFWAVVAFFNVYYDWAAILFDPATFEQMKGYDYQYTNVLKSAMIATVVGGIFVASIEVLYFNRLLRKRPFGISMLVKTAFYMTNIFLFTSLGYLLEEGLNSGKAPFHEDIIQDYLIYLGSPRQISIWIFWSMAVILALFILQISEKLGQGILVNFLLGKYHRPREETRVFMFLDLKSSTGYAEKLGHIKYSELIQDCFYDLTDVVAKHGAQIYQYVGDEVVLTWKYEEGLKNQNCIRAFIDYDRIITGKSGYYEEKYGMVPEFKAGLDGGKVTAAEVGEIKKELAYHGDVLNTASRIMEKCNEFKTKLLISERLKDKLSINFPEDGFELIGEVKLKGKEKPVKIFKVNLGK